MAGNAIRPLLLRALAWALALALLAGCAGPEKRGPRKVCPRVDILEYADTLVRFLPGPGRDVTDILFRTRLVNFQAECEVDEAAIDVELVLEFASERGPANRDRKAGARGGLLTPFPAVAGPSRPLPLRRTVRPAGIPPGCETRSPGGGQTGGSDV